MFVQLASMQQPWRRHSGWWFCGSCTSEYSTGVFFPLCVLHCRYEYTEKRKGGNINYQVVERRDTVNTREDTKRGEKGDGRYGAGERRGGGEGGRSFVRQAPAVVRHWNL